MRSMILLAILTIPASVHAAGGIFTVAPQFNPSLGTLKQVDISVVGTASQIFTAPSMFPGVPPPLPLASAYDYTEIVDVFAGQSAILQFTRTGTVPTVGKFVEVSTDLRFASNVTDPASLAAFTGLGNIFLSAAVQILLRPAGSTHADGSLAIEGGPITLGGISASYVSLPPGVTAEPPTGLMAMIALVVIISARQLWGRYR